MKKKLEISDLQIQSFVTKANTQTKGGATLYTCIFEICAGTISKETTPFINCC